ncbi:MAG: hypothetical protein QG675_623 [Patescibacteria group bacterium]|jgi:hypothetical protein|nr:hypothetical protein [Patescibacteria group bacterium]
MNGSVGISPSSNKRPEMIIYVVQSRSYKKAKVALVAGWVVYTAPTKP